MSDSEEDILKPDEVLEQEDFDSVYELDGSLEEVLEEEEKRWEREKLAHAAGAVIGYEVTPEIADFAGKVASDLSPEAFNSVFDRYAEMPELVVATLGAYAGFRMASRGYDKAINYMSDEEEFEYLH